MGQVLALWVKRGRRAPMDPAESVELIEGKGIAGDANRSRFRQVTLLDEAAWQAAERDLGHTVDPRVRRANVLLRGIDLLKTRDRILQLGDCRLKVLGETTPCRKMDDDVPGLQAALRPDWRGGVFGQVIVPGTLRVGDAVDWLAGD